MIAGGRPAASEQALGNAQRWLFDRVTSSCASAGFAASGANADAGARATHSAGCAGSEDECWVRGGRVPAAERIDVYRRGYFSRLMECLADDYPALAAAIGGAEFQALCLDFIEDHPPASASLNFFGAPFPEFCATRPAPFAACASELARLEWAVVEAIHADATNELDPLALAALPEADWSRARLVPSPALRVLRTAYPVHRHYRAFLSGERPALPELEPSVIAVCRRGDDVWRLGVPTAFAAVLEHLVGGRSLASALEAIPTLDAGSQGAGAAGDGPAELQRVFSEWVACGFFSGIVVD